MTYEAVVLFKVGHVQKVSLVPGKVHEMKTLSLKPLLFGKYQNLFVLSIWCSISLVNTNMAIIRMLLCCVCVQKFPVSYQRGSVQW